MLETPTLNNKILYLIKQPKQDRLLLVGAATRQQRTTRVTKTIHRIHTVTVYILYRMF